ncbi:MAG: hypothetical protein ACLQPV_03050 [Vulcanimicrobiaceae bacterium]
MTLRIGVIVALMATAVLLPSRAGAALSVAGGAFVQGTPSQVGGAAMITGGAAIPAVPLAIQATLLVPVTGQGGYSLTAEIRGQTGGGFGGAYVGAGVGVGNLSSDRSTGSVLTVLAGKPISPYVSIEARLFKGLQETGSTDGFLGLRFTL